MFVSWTVLRSPVPTEALPWRPAGARWWQAGHCSPGRPAPPADDGTWWSVLATWESRGGAEAGPADRPDVSGWHVVLDPVAYRGDAVLAGGSRPFDGLPSSGHTDGAVVVVTLAGTSRDDGREREFARRFGALARTVAGAPGLRAALVQAPGDGAVLTLSAWADLPSALAWAYERPPHAGAVARQASHQLVQTTGYLRCAVVSSSGTLGDVPDPLAGPSG